MNHRVEAPFEADVVVVGAGLAGATAARALANAGLRVSVLDKGRGPGGRLSTRRGTAGGFDHGASSLQAGGDDFRAWLDGLILAGVASRWRHDEWVGVPGMNAVVSHLLDGIDVRWSTAVATLAHHDGRWWARVAGDGAPLFCAPQLVLAVPAPQALALCETLADGAAPAGIEGVRDALASARYAPCWAAMVVTTGDPAGAAPASGINGPVLARLVREADKPARPEGHWVLHATTRWSERHLEQSPDEVAGPLRDAFLAATGFAPHQVLALTPHRWRYAVPDRGVAHLGLAEQGLHLAGDAVGWHPEAGMPPAEQAWCSGRIAAERVLRAVARQPKS